jgi:hypothetical protein
MGSKKEWGDIIILEQKLKYSLFQQKVRKKVRIHSDKKLDSASGQIIND